MFYLHVNGHLISGLRVTTSDGDWDDLDRENPPPGWTWHDSPEAARAHYGLPAWFDIETIGANIEAAIEAVEGPALTAALATLYEETLATVVPFAPVPNFGHGPGVVVGWEGEEHRNVSGTWLHSSPADYPLGWAQLTGLPDDVEPWVPNEAVAVGDLREHGGVTYRVVQAHTTQAGWEPPNVPALWAPQG